MKRQVSSKRRSWSGNQDKTSTTESQPALRLCEVKKPITSTVDASSKNLGAVLLQEGETIAYGARTLT